MNNEKLNTIIDEIIKTNNVELKEEVYNVVLKVINLSDGTETSIIKLVGEKSGLNQFQLFEINEYVREICKKINIKLENVYGENAITGLPFNVPFIKKSL